MRLQKGGIKVALDSTSLRNGCDRLRSLHQPGKPLLLPNVWDVATARAVVKAGFPVVATTSWGVSAVLGYDDHEVAPAAEMLAAAARISRCVGVPVTVDAEAGYGMEPAALVAALREAGAAGCNLEDTEYTPGVPHDHAAGTLQDPNQHANWLRSVRQAAEELDYPLVINARVDNFLSPFIAGAEPKSQRKLVPDALERASAYLEAGADCVYPIALWEPEALSRFMSEVRGPVNISRVPQISSVANLAALGVARVSWALYLFFASMAHFEEQLRAIQA